MDRTKATTGMAGTAKRSAFGLLGAYAAAYCMTATTMGCSDESSLPPPNDSGAGGTTITTIEAGTGGKVATEAGRGGSNADAATARGDGEASVEASREGSSEGGLLGGLRKAAADANKLIGAAVNASALRDDPTYGEVLAREFDYVTPENSMKWGPLQPTKDTYDWTEADALVSFANGHAQAIKGHTFVWHRQTPTWVDASMSAEDLRAALKKHIETTLARYSGRIRAWDVVNEAVDMSTASHYTDSIFYQKLGPSYIEDAFRWARAADADVLLYYNEVGIERMGPKSDFTYELMRDLKTRGVPIDGIGFQSHISDHRYPSESNLRANIRRFAALGLKVNLSEIDVRTLLMPGTQQSRWNAQRLAFQQLVGACVVEPGCEAITLWGFTDKYTWINDNATDLDDPLIFDRSYAAKPAYDGVVDGLRGLLPVRGANLVQNGDFAAGQTGWATTGGRLSTSVEDGGSAAKACVSGRATDADALVQSALLSRLSAGGPMSFSAQVRLVADTATASATDGGDAGRATDSGAEAEASSNAAGDASSASDAAADSDGGGDGSTSAQTASATVQVALTIQEEGIAAWDLSLGNVVANDQGWTELSGYFALGFKGTPTAVGLKLYGPPAGLTLCVSDVKLQPLTVK